MKQNLIFIHGFRGNSTGLMELKQFFDSPEEYQTFFPDLPPAGGKSLERYDANHYADFLMRYIKIHHIENPILIGHSMGSIIAAATAEKYPELLNKKIIFVSPISVKPYRFVSMFSPFTALLPNRIVTYISTKYLFVAKDKNLFRHTLEASYLCGADYTSKKEVYQSAKFSSHNAISDFKFKKEVCFISGEKDRLIPKAATEKLALKLHGETSYIKNCGHLVNYENAEAVAKIIKNFLKKN